MPYYCYLCNEQMRANVYVCDAHKHNPQTRARFDEIIQACSHGTLEPRIHPWAPTAPFALLDADTTMDVGL